jgi:2-polyprenyl-3-methyl-5-hydroxy-6-metoxy-1,4-benzoquinol methylase
MPNGWEKFHNIDLIREVIKEFPDVKFKFFGGTNIPDKKHKKKEPANLEWCGVIAQDKMGEFIDSCSCLMRLSEHDGFPITIAEFASAGRNIIFNREVPYGIKADLTKESVITAIRYAQKENFTGADYYKDAHTVDKFKARIDKELVYDPKEYWENRAEAWDEGEGSMPTGIEKALSKLIKKMKPTSILDVGCGNGRFVNLLTKECKDYVGMDISENLIDICKKKYPDYHFEASKIEDYQGKTDLAFCYTIFEHIIEPDMPKAVEALKRIAKRAILVEPMGFISRYYCHNHDYNKYFKIEKMSPLIQNQDGTFDDNNLYLMVIDLED